MFNSGSTAASWIFIIVALAIVAVLAVWIYRAARVVRPRPWLGDWRRLRQRDRPVRFAPSSTSSTSTPRAGIGRPLT